MPFFAMVFGEPTVIFRAADGKTVVNSYKPGQGWGPLGNQTIMATSQIAYWDGFTRLVANEEVAYAAIRTSSESVDFFKLKKTDLSWEKVYSPMAIERHHHNLQLNLVGDDLQVINAGKVHRHVIDDDGPV